MEISFGGHSWAPNTPDPIICRTLADHLTLDPHLTEMCDKPKLYAVKQVVCEAV